MLKEEKLPAEARFYRCTRTAVAAFTHVLCIAFTVFLVFLSRPGSSLFSWHPFLMTLAVSHPPILPHGSPVRKFAHKTKGRIHWVLQCMCVTCAIAGLVVIVHNKNVNDKPHLTSWHGLLGLITVCVIGLQSVAALPLIYHPLAKGWSLAKLKRYHAASGLVTYLLGCATLLLGLCSAWFTAAVSDYTWYLSALCPALSALVIMDQVSRTYTAKKRLQS
uniref:ascorbate ferrireductase (transmembrane) n=1 Tax=Neogobius melanostomus TaxID=47308 RepID=A0A8C6THR4_9GOBI